MREQQEKDLNSLPTIDEQASVNYTEQHPQEKNVHSSSSSQVTFKEPLSAFKEPLSALSNSLKSSRYSNTNKFIDLLKMQLPEVLN